MTHSPKRALMRGAVALVAAGALALSGCSTGTETPSGGDDEVSIGVIFLSNLQPRWKYDEAAMKAEADAQGYKLIVKYADGTSEDQAKIAETMFSQGIDVLVINPVDPAGAGAIADKAHLEGIQVISYDQPIGADVDLNIQRSMQETGALQVSRALDAVPAGEYAIIRGDNASGPNAGILLDQYESAIAEHPEVSIVYSDWTPGWDPSEAQAHAETALSKNPDIAVMLVSNDGMATGVIQALRSAGRAGQVYVTGLDANEENLKLIYDGEQNMTVYTDVIAMSKLAIDSAGYLVRGEAPPDVDQSVMNGEFKAPTVFVPIISVEKENLCDFFKIAPEGWANPDVVFGADNPCS